MISLLAQPQWKPRPKKMICNRASGLTHDVTRHHHWHVPSWDIWLRMLRTATSLPKQPFAFLICHTTFLPTTIRTCSKITAVQFAMHWFSLGFWASCLNHCLVPLDLGAGVEQPFDSLIVQNRQSMQSMRRSMAWTFEDNMVDSLFFCGCSAAVKSDPSCFLEGQPGGVGTGVGQLLDLQPES